MNVLQLTSALVGVALTDEVLISAPSNPVFDKILSLAVVADTVDTDGVFTIRLAEISTTFRLGAPFNTALDELLSTANILDVDVVSEPETSKFEIDT